MIYLEIFRMLGFCFRLILQADDLRCYLVHFFVCCCRLAAVTSVCTDYRYFFSVGSRWCIGFCCFGNVYKNRIFNLMCRRHRRCHTHNRVILIQFYRNYKGCRTSCFRTRIIYISIRFYILVMRTAECDRCICLTACNRYLAASDVYLSSSAWPWEAVRCVYTVF